MKSILPLFFVSCLALQVSAQRFDLKFMFDGFQRECIVVKPSTPPPPGGYPVVFMLHGTSGDGEKFYNISGWKELGEQENFITVFPSSLEWCFVEDGVEKHNTRWVNGNVTENPCSGPPQNYVDDVKFLKTLVQLLIDTLPVNKSKVFASGFSNGSAMIHKLANDAGDVFAAVAGCSAPLTMSDSVLPVKRIPVWFMVGTLDDRFIVPPYTELPFGEDSILIYLNGLLNRALACQGLSQTFVKNISPITHTYIFNQSNPGESSKPYLFTLIKDMIHEYPNGANYPLSAPVIFWQFFNQSTMVSTKSESKNLGEMEVYPNPSNDYVKVNFKNFKRTSPVRIKMMNSFGQIVFQDNQLTASELVLFKKEFGSGIFYLQMETTNGSICKKVAFL